MQRKNFIGTALAASLAIPFASFTPREEEAAGIRPPYLKPGDLVGITAPAGYIMNDEIQPAIERLQNWGFRVKVGNTIGKRDFTFGGTDEERRMDFQQMLDDKEVKAILCARGGYGSVRLIDDLKWQTFKTHPKWIIGFSDITVIHSHLNRNFGIASIHSKMCNSFPDTWANAEPIQIETILSIQKALSGEKMNYPFTANPCNKTGKADGVLVGGNLRTLENLSGSASDLRTQNKILFVEDTGEYMYSIDRMFWNLKRSGKLEGLKALIVGGFKVKVDEGDDEYGKTLQDVVLEKVRSYDYPVCFDFPVGHQKNNFALKCGLKHRLVVQSSGCTLTEL